MTAAIQSQIDWHLTALAGLFRQIDGRRPTDRRLSDREMQVVMLAASTPLTYVEIGKRLFLAPSTVRTNMKRAMAKLGVRRRIELPQALRGLGDGQ